MVSPSRPSAQIFPALRLVFRNVKRLDDLQLEVYADPLFHASAPSPQMLVADRADRGTAQLKLECCDIRKIRRPRQHDFILLDLGPSEHEIVDGLRIDVDPL